jgi:hypothetical protein
MRGFNADQLNSPDGAFGVMFLREQGGREQQQKYDKSVELPHFIDLLKAVS